MGNDVIDSSGIWQGLRHHRHLTARTVIGVGTAKTAGKIFVLPLQVARVETGEAWRAKGFIAFSTASVTCAAIAIVEIGTASGIAGIHGSRAHDRQRGRICSHCGNSIVINQL